MEQAQKDKTVKMGMLIGLLLNLVLYSTAYFLLPTFTSELLLVERIRLGFECLLFPAFFMLAMVLKVGAQRYGNSAEDPTVVQANTQSMKVDLRVLSNTHEQLIILPLTRSVLLSFCQCNI